MTEYCCRAILDPALFSIPGAATTEQEALDAVQSIVNWSSALSGPSPVAICKLSNTLELLAETSDFPSQPNIQSMLELFNLMHAFNANDVSKLVDDLIVRSKEFIDVSSVEALASDGGVILPDPFPEGIAPQIRAGTECAIATVLMSCCGRMGDGNSTCLACGYVPSMVPQSAKLTVSELHTQRNEQELSAPLTVFGPIAAYTSPIAMLSSLNAMELWLAAKEGRMAVLAIALKIKEIFREMGNAVPLEELPIFWVGSDFIRSVRSLGLGGGDHASVILETCARLLMDMPKNEVLPFLDAAPSKGGKRQLHRADGARAFRTHITKSHEALRLMAWQNEDIWELANVGPKSDEEILSTDTSERISSTWIRELLPD